MRACIVLLLGFAIPQVTGAAADRVIVGSKAFAESWILGEAASLAIEQHGSIVEHKRNLGGTQIAYEALRSGEIDLYPEYSGTIEQVILHADHRLDLDDMRARLSKEGLEISAPLGFSNSYALAVSSQIAGRCHLKVVSDLRACPSARWGLSHEFLGREDGWPQLRIRYGLDLVAPQGFQHELAYEAIRQANIDVTDVYTTDPQIDELHLLVLADDADFFPRYDAVYLYRRDLGERFPAALAALRGLRRIDEHQMREANAAILHGASARDIARRWLPTANPGNASASHAWAADLAGHVARHLELVAISMVCAILIGIPAGVLASRSASVGTIVLSMVNLLQTIPSLALLAFLIPVFGVGVGPALIALFVYSLLPIVRNTCAGIANIPRPLIDSATVIGLTPWVRLRRIELPMASPVILAGIRTSAVVNVATATLAALIGAGGLGSPILQGIALRSSALILEGAIPTALLALMIDGVFAWASVWLVPRGLRLRPGR